MKLNFLETFEEKFYFKTSHLFWHFLIGLAGLAFIAGVLVFLWGITPSLKPGVDKPEYPEPVKISAAEIKKIVTPPPPSPETTPEPAAATAGPAPDKAESSQLEPEPEVSPEEKAYHAALDSLRVLLPPEKFAWESRGHWKRSWYRKRWVVDVLGIEDRLKRAFREVNAENFTTQKNVVESYFPVLTRFAPEERMTVLRAAIDVTRENMAESRQTLELLTLAADSFKVESADLIKDLAKFSNKNPRDGHTFLRYTSKVMPKFDADVRLPALELFTRFYYREFKHIDRQQEATDLFLPMVSEFEGNDQLKALVHYYQLYLDRNASRAREIAELNEKYAQEQQEAASVLASKKQGKAELRGIAWKLIGGSLFFIALVALFLVLLSMQRNLRLLRENMVVSK